MIKNTLLLIFIIFSCFQSFAQLPETFDGPGFPNEWISFPGENGNGASEGWEMNDSAGYPYVEGDATVPTGELAQDWLVSPQIFVDPDTPILTFHQTDYFDEDMGSQYYVKISTGSQSNISDFTTIFSQTEDGFPFHGIFSEKAIDLTSYIGQNIYIAFVFENNNGDMWFIDNLNLVPYANAPDAVTGPTPTDGAIDVNLDVEDTNGDGTPDNRLSFAWVPATTGDPATSFDFYFGNAADNLELITNTNNTFLDLTSLEFETEYFWKVVAKNVGGEATGSQVWSFTTTSEDMAVQEYEKEALSFFYNEDEKELHLLAQIPIDEVMIYSILGEKVLHSHTQRKEEYIPLGFLNSGMYLAKIRMNDQVRTVKFVKK